MVELTIEEITAFCKQKGFIFQSSEIYGGFSGFWDYGPLGIELFNNIKQHMWTHFVHNQENMVGIDSSIICNPKVWKASGHLDNFGDLLVNCKKCKIKFRADHLIEEKLDINVEGKPVSEINEIIVENKLSCPECKGELAELKNFNLLFKTFVGADEEKASETYLRGETAQGMFTDFRLVADSSRQKLPFGIFQIGKCFRNEISPRDFIFRSREFTIGEFEFFIHPNDDDCDQLTKKHLGVEFFLLDAKTQEGEEKDLKKKNINTLIENNQIGKWHAYWLAEQVMWVKELGIDLDNIKIREHTSVELSHYSKGTFDLDYQFPFGSKEIGGNADRGQYDLTQHIKESKEKLELYDEQTKEKIVPRVIEPTFGLDRVFLAVLIDGYTTRKDEKGKDVVVLKLKPKLAPFKCAVLPLVNKEPVFSKAKDVFEILQKRFHCFFDRSGSVGRRYVRQDEIGTPFCITIDFESVDDETVTVRQRDSTRQIRVEISSLPEKLTQLINEEISFEDAGRLLE